MVRNERAIFLILTEIAPVKHLYYNSLMRKIRKLYYFDKKRMQDMISFLNNRDKYINHIMFNPLSPLHHLLPLRFKFLPESYVLKDKKEIKGLITVAPSRCPLKKMEIQRLFFEENCYDDAGELIQFVVSKYKAMGASSFVVKIDDCLPELLKLFVAKCGFSQISYEKLWHVNSVNVEFNKKDFREFRNSDAQIVANLYNESLLPHFRPLLSRNAKEFKEIFFKGLSYFNEYKYVIEDKASKNITCYLSIQTSDNENFILDIIKSSWVELDISAIISFANTQIAKRQKKFNLYVKTKKYTQSGEKDEKYFMENKFECVQNQVVLTNSSARIIRENVHTGQFTILNQFCGVRPIAQNFNN